MSVLFHPEMPFALLCALALLVFLRASRREWPNALGWLLGALLGAAALTRQPAVVLIGCMAAAGIYLGRRGAAAFLVRAAILVALVAGPWWGYAAVRFGNPLQSNLAPRASLMMGSQPPSFYVSFPLRTLVVHPYRPDFSNSLFPKLHAELWSDWFGVVHSQPPTRLERVTMSTQSVLGLVADALAIGGLFALAVPAAIRVFRRSRAPADTGLGLLAVVALGAFAAFVIELVRFPQHYGDPIKSSYLLFTTPCWAIFSVAAWCALRRRKRIGAALVAVAALYVVSYATDLEAALSQPTSQRLIGGLGGFVDLSTTIQQTSPNPGVGGPVNFLVGVNNTGDQTAGDVMLTVELPPSMHLLGAPFYERGSGCTGTSTIVCNLDFLAAKSSTLIRFGVDVDAPGPQTLTATASSAQPDGNPDDNASSYTVNLS
jgi:4-amino-4-deoxy-L-arabinose transferase-like glycosyltransferase